MTDLSSTSRNKINMPLVGFGTYQLSTEEAESSVAEALRAGYRHIDSAEGYNNEKGTGNAIKKSGIAREEIFLTTKLFPGNTQWGVQEKTYDSTIATLKNQLKELQVDYVDLYLIHAPLASLRLEQWRALIELKKQGLTKHIGVSNYNEEAINEILEAGLEKPEINQIEFHPLCAQPELTQFLNKHSIASTAYSSLAPLSTWRTAEGQGGEVLAEKKQDAQSTIKEVASELNVSEAKLLLRWVLQNGYSVLTRSTNPQRIKENIDLFDFTIPQSQMQRLNDLNQNQAFAWAANGLNPMEAAPALK
ncbi:aldo/keto reductase family protein [Flagellimonas meridianipacifica]|uniref:2,5-diketo-D-gluconate reductase A n=1 Tax=Flagellimonas meridianipacifica TaxID=1080225 RepID=A0A2T0MBS2_9FLAO|nr:aldo/keto reductase [Allomuricauda pacifica]PRX54940.1 2,5-diketo-D-gluconate reductase A [Allomuricauda pacifica]